MDQQSTETAHNRFKTGHRFSSPQAGKRLRTSRFFTLVELLIVIAIITILAALLLGGVWGGMAGSVGMTIADLMIPVYVISAPKTFLLKLGIGLITGLVAHGVFKLSRDKERKIPLVWATALSCTAGMAFNVVADPVVGYFYKMYILGVPQSAAQVWMNFNFLTTGVNAVVAIVVSTVLYLALRPALKRANLLPQV